MLRLTTAKSLKCYQPKARLILVSDISALVDKRNVSHLPLFRISVKRGTNDVACGYIVSGIPRQCCAFSSEAPNVIDCVHINGAFSWKARRHLETSPIPIDEFQRPRRQGGWKKWAGGIVVIGCVAPIVNEDIRYWIFDRIPSLKSMFAYLGVNVDRPIALPDELVNVTAPLVKPSPPVESTAARPKEYSSSSSSSSLIDVADKTVSGLSVDKALANDLNKKAAWTREAVEKHFGTCDKPGLVKPTEADTCPVTGNTSSQEHESNIQQIKERKIGDHDGASLLQAGADSAKLILSNYGSPTAAQLEERSKKENERYQQKMAERERKDAEYLQREKEKRERKATLELEKQKKQEAEEKEAAEAYMTTVKKNMDFESWASKRITEVLEMADAAITINAKAIDTCREHAAKLKEAMDVNLEEEAIKIWPIVHDLNDVRLQRIEEAHKVQQVAEEAIIDYLKLIEAAKSDRATRDNKTIPVYRKQIQQIAYDVRSIHEKLKSQETVATIMKHYYQMMKKDKSDFLKELEAIVPQIQIGEKGLNVSEEELNALLAHSHRRIFQLKRQLMEQQLLEHQRLEDALCEQRKADLKEANIKIGEELDKQHHELQLLKEAELLAQSRKFEAEIDHRISKKTSSYHDHLQDMLALQQKQLMERFDLALKERLIHERHVFIDHIAKNMAKVKGLEAALEERANLEKVVTEVQAIMSSALCLVHAVAHDVDCVGDEYDIVRIDEPLRRCFLAAEQCPFAQAILHTVPNLAAERGIYTMSSLEKRFEDVYKKCTESLPGWSKYKAEPKPKYTQAVDFETAEGMSQSEILIQAQYFMNNKCMSEAVRCLIQLEGTARTLAQDWIEEARLVLEVRQAAEVLMSYAHSRGMGTIF